MIRVADYILKRVEEQGVKHVFYVPGGQCVYLMDALRRSEGVEGIATHHEQAAAMAALTYSLYNNNFGACIVTTGCAGTNTITGVLHAWQDSIPCIFISGQQNVEQTIAYSGLPLRQVGVQEADIVSIVSSITKYAVMLTKPEQVAYELDKAIHLATTGRKGPAWIDVPLNIQNAMIDENKMERYTESYEVPDLSADDEQYVIECLNNSKRPVVFAGKGVQMAHADNELREFAEKFKIPVVFTRYSTDIMEFDAPQNYGIVCSVGANRYANFMIQNSDCVLNVGCRLSIDTTGPEQDKFAREAKVISVDIDETEHQKKGVAIDRIVKTDAKLFFEKMLKANIKCADELWIEKCDHWKKIFAPDWNDIDKKELIDVKYFYERLSENAPANSVFLSDAGMAGAALSANCHLKKGGRILHAYAQGEMGYTLPGAVGAAACASDRMIFAVTGDGSVMMNLQELQTIVRNKFNIKIIIINNNGYSGVRHGQKAHFRGKSYGTDPSNGLDFPDFGKVADAFGIKYCKIEAFDQIEGKLKDVMQDNEPYICEVICDPDQFDLHNALVTYGKRKFGFRPIEDQSPFIDREVFFKEMIIEPMETSYGTPV